MDRKNPGQKRNERPNEVEDERSERSGLKTETKTQGLKPDAALQPEEEPYEVEDDEDEDGEQDDDE